MFFRLTYYQIKRLLHKKDTMFWTLCFPILLGTMFFFGFGHVMEDNEIMKDIPIAVVERDISNRDSDFVKVVDQLKDTFKIHKVNEQEAKKLLDNKKITGYYLIGSKVELVVGDSGIQENIMKQVLDQYNRLRVVLLDLMQEDPTMIVNQSKINDVIQKISDGTEYTKEITLGSGKADSMIAYFYALIAMVCIYGSMMGADIVMQLEGNISLIGARRNFAPASKMVQVVSDVCGSFVVHMAEIGIVLIYLKQVLHIDFGDKLGYILLACVFGSLIGISLGTFICMIIPGKKAGKETAVISVSMVFCFLSGLMVADLPHLLEKSCPIVNRLNPCMQLVNSFYSLNIYSSLNKYFTCLSTMAIMAVVLLTATILLMRRRKYASI